VVCETSDVEGRFVIFVFGSVAAEIARVGVVEALFLDGWQPMETFVLNEKESKIKNDRRKKMEEICFYFLSFAFLRYSLLFA
jgi:NADH:ubiquinone oxidoreductase subunit H